VIGPGIGSWPARRARMDPTAVALCTADEDLTYAELAAQVDVTAARLRELGVRPGTRVAYLGPNSIDTWVCFFATARAGGIFVSLNIRLAAPEIAHMLADSGSHVLVHGPECAELAAGADPVEQGVAHVLAAADLRPASGPDSTAGSVVSTPVGIETWPSPVTWKSGAAHSATSVLSTSTCTSWFTVFHVMLPWVSTAPLGRPVVPEV